MQRIVLTDTHTAFPEYAREMITRAGFACVDADDADPLAAIRDADALLVIWYPVTRKVIEQLTHCKIIVRIGIGVDNVDLEAARECGIPVCNVPDYCLDEVADHAFALTMSLLRRLPSLDRGLRQGIWRLWQITPVISSANQTFATLGFGRIARAVLLRARACRFKLAACDPYVDDETFAGMGVSRMTLEEIFEKADILSLHAPLTAETHHVVDAGHLSRMKHQAILINTSRGALVDTDALVKALQSGRISGAGLDVFETEPLELGHPLLDCDNVLLTPHYAAYTEQSLWKLYTTAAENAIIRLQGGPLRHCVNGLE